MRPGQLEAVLDLQPLLNAVCEAAGYVYYIYRRHLSPPLHHEDAKWAEQLIGAQARAT